MFTSQNAKDLKVNFNCIIPSTGILATDEGASIITYWPVKHTSKLQYAVVSFQKYGTLSFMNIKKFSNFFSRSVSSCPQNPLKLTFFYLISTTIHNNSLLQLSTLNRKGRQFNLLLCVTNSTRCVRRPRCFLTSHDEITAIWLAFLILADFRLSTFQLMSDLLQGVYTKVLTGRGNLPK